MTRLARPILVVAGVLALSIIVLACSSTVSHETDDLPYTSIDEVGGATYTPMPAADDGIEAYRGSAVARVQTPGNEADDERAHGVVDLNPDMPYRTDGWYAAAFYFPAGTFSGDTPNQGGQIDIMRWEGVAGQFGGIRIMGNHQAQLVRGSGGSVTGTIGSPFSLAEGCWNWVAVRQLISTGPGAVNEVWLNGQRIVSASNVQNAHSTTAVTALEYGYSTTDPQQDSALTYYVDDASYGPASAGIAEPAAGVCGQPEPGVERPNVLIFMTDDQRAGTEDSRPTPESPYLMQATRDKFITQGREFGKAYATTPLCCPSRASIFTGRYAHNHGVRENQLAENLGTTEDGAGQKTTLQYYLKNASPAYRTAIFGKYLNGWSQTLKPPYFDDWAVFRNFREDDPETPQNEEQPHLSVSTVTPDVCETGPSTELSEVCVSQRDPATGQNVRKPMPSGVYETDFLAQRVESFLDQAEDGPGEDDVPWLMYVTPTVPHAPFTPKAEYADLPVAAYADDVPAEALEEDRGDKPRYIRDNPNAATTSAAETEHDAQLRMLKSADDLVQDVFDALDARGETGTTLAFFVSDNGYMWGEHGRLGKDAPYKDSVRIPMMVRWPNHPEQVPAGSLDSRMVANIDIATTVMSALGLKPSAQTPMDGRSVFDAGARARMLVEGWVRDPLEPGERPLCEELGYCRPASAPPTDPGQVVPTDEIPTFAMTAIDGPHGYNYTRYYLFDPSTDPPLENRTIFREFYPGTDAFQLDNLFGPDGAPGGGDDLGSTPPELILGAQLERDRRCSGRRPGRSWPPPCP